jgi:hypothetical protein
MPVGRGLHKGRGLYVGEGVGAEWGCAREVGPPNSSTQALFSSPFETNLVLASRLRGPRAGVTGVATGTVLNGGSISVTVRYKPRP